MSYAVVLSTLPSKKKAIHLASILLDQKVAACVTVSSSCQSLYRWEGKKERAKEFIILIKTKTALLKRLEKVIREHHPYSVPEIIALPIRSGNSAYLRWIGRACSQTGRRI